ncbi:GTP-binding protein HflX [Staphylococcus lugdunensis M23590]|nr:GTP-binding protein HflX [Staphylococcus lugdunensis M23590]
MHTMVQQAAYSTQQKRETAVLVGANAQVDNQFDYDSTMQELQALSQTCQLEVVSQITQNRQQVDHKYYVGKGKIDEIKAFIDLHDIDVVVANDELTTAQSKSLNDALDVKIIDRTQLILEIFALRAKSKEGKLQVELAQLDYLLPRLQGHGKSLSRLGGGIGTRGPGETKLEMDRRHIRTRINEIKHQLQTIVEHRERYRNKREQNQVFQIALVGYTNAGKSSWFNVLSGESTYEQNLLFATLDPKTRQIQLNEGFNVIITDTVGFIQKLPTTLVAAFKSTLEEAKNADILLHIVDASHPEFRSQYETVNQLIQELEMDQIPQVVLFNKRDLCPSTMALPMSSSLSEFVSTQHHSDITKVKALLIKQIKESLTYYSETVASSNAQRIYFLKQHTLIEEMNFNPQNNCYEVTGYRK